MVKLALVTAGHIHTPGFVKRMRARTDVHVEGVYDPNPSIASRFAEELHTNVRTAAELIGDATVDAVIISGRTDQHAGLVEQAAAAGKHLFVEKPLSTTVADANRLYTAITDAGVLFQTGYAMRSNPIYRFIKQEILAGNFGTVTRARCSVCHSAALGGWFDPDYRWFYQADRSGGGAFLDLGCHAVDLLIFLFGPVAAGTAALNGGIKYPNIDEYGEGLLTFRNGIIASVAAGWVDQANPVGLLISGTEGHAYERGGELFYLSRKSVVAGADGKAPMDKALFPPELPHAFDIFLDVLTGKMDKANLISVADALHVIKVMDALYMGHKFGSWVNVM